MAKNNGFCGRKKEVQQGVHQTEMENLLKPPAIPILTMTSNSNLHKAKVVKNDEFYTQLTDIEKELRHYKPHFKDKVVFCNCDDQWSNFYRYFKMNFDHLGLRKLISLHFDRHEPTYALIVENGTESKVLMRQNGDFRCAESIAYLDECDIVCTNPPFSLFREFVSTLEEHGKKYLIIGSMNAITYKEIFPLIKNNRLWLGNNHVKEFMQPDGTVKKFGNINWYTNMDYPKRHESLPLYKQYHSDEYHKYDTYDAVNVDRVEDIPKDYLGTIGVPISYLDKHNPDEYDIVGTIGAGGEYNVGYSVVDRKPVYKRILIRKRESNSDYPRYDGYDAIEVSKVADIPSDYTGLMGVPITYLEKHNPDD